MDDKIESVQSKLNWRKVPVTKAGGNAGKPDTEDVPEPVAGMDTNYDEARRQVKEAESKLYEYLEGVKKRMAPEAADCKESLLKEKINNKSIIDRIKFVNCRRRFEIEVPVSLVKEKKPDDFVLTSKRDGVERF